MGDFANDAGEAQRMASLLPIRTRLAPLLAAALLGCAGAGASAPPDIVWIVLDTLRPDHLEL